MKPHKCPVCDGAGEFVYTVGELPEKCKACDGKGIVWPPLGYYPPYVPPTVTWCWGGAGTAPHGAGI